MTPFAKQAEMMCGWLRKARYEPVAYEDRWQGRKCVAVRTSDSPFLVGAVVAREAGDDAWMLGNFNMRAEVTEGRDPYIYFPSLPWVEAAEQVAA